MYRFCRYRRNEYGNIESKIFDIENKSMLNDYLKTEEKGWYKHHMLVPEFSVDEPVETGQNDADVLALLNGEGLNHSSFTRLISGKRVVNQYDKAKTKKEYDAILEKFNGRLIKQNRDWFLNDRT